MSNITKVETSATISTTEHDLVQGAAYSAGTLAAGPAYVVLELDVDALLITDTFTLRLRTDVNGDVANVVDWVLQGPYTDHVRIDFGLIADYAITLIRTTGSDRSVGWKLLTDLGSPTVAEMQSGLATAAAVAALPSAATIAAAVVAATVLRAGTATAGDLTSITLDVGAPTTVDLFKGAIIEIISGTGAGQCETITSYTAGRRAYVTSFVTAPGATSVYIIRGAPGRLAILIKDDLTRVLGISKDNAMLDRTVYSGGKMTGGRLRVFGDASELAAATADTPNDNDDGETQRYTIAATYSGDELVSYSMTRAL